MDISKAHYRVYCSKNRLASAAESGYLIILGQMKLSLIVAVSDNNVIAKDGRVPWYVRGEQAILKRVTLGKPVIMGRLTYEAPKNYKARPRALPGRLNIVVSRNPDYSIAAGGVVVGSLAEALRVPEVQRSAEVLVIGGEQLFIEALPLADRLYLTRVHTIIQGGDKFFRFDPTGWRLISSKLYKKGLVPDRPYDFEFQIWDRQ